MDRPLVVFDIERAANRGAPHAVEIGAVRVRDGEIADTFESLCRPLVPIDPEASDVHGLEDTDVAGAPPTAEVVATFLEWLGDDWLVAHRAEADARALAFECERAGLTPPDAPVLDTLALARRVFPDAPDHRLDTLCDWLGLEDGPRHRALADAVWCWRVLAACCERLDPPVTAAALLALAPRPTSVAAEAPRPRRQLKPRHRRLARARGERVTILYGDEDGEPVPLAVTPLILFQLGERAYLEGECASSGLLKTYRLDRIRQVR